MTGTTPRRTDATAPRTTAEFRLDEAAHDALTPYLRYRDGEEFRIGSLDGDVAHVGRRPGNDIVLSADGRVSGRHARLTHAAGEWSIADAGSKNGTLVNGRPLTRERRLSD